MNDRYILRVDRNRLQVWTLPGAFKSLVVLSLIRVTPESHVVRQKNARLFNHSNEAKARLVFYLGRVRYNPYSGIRIYMIEENRKISFWLS